jgi:metal-sulfur cluster biosynthetic enzyme
MFGDEVELWIIYFVNISTLERFVQFTFVITTSCCPLTCRGHLFPSHVTLYLLEVV